MHNRYENNPPTPPFDKGVQGGFIEGVFFITGKDFKNAGAASSELKAMLEKIGINHGIIRRVALPAFEIVGRLYALGLKC